MNRTRLTRVVYVLFGLALLTSNLDALQTSVDPLPLLAAILSVGIVVVGLVGLVRPDATVRGVHLGVGERPTWLLALLVLATVLLFVGTALGR